MLRTTAIAKELAVIERKLQETTNKTLKDALRKKQARLKDELNDFKKSTPSLAKKLLAQRAQIKQLSKMDFSDLVRRLSKKPEYSFLRTMSKSTIRTDIERPAKPVGWRFKGRGNYDKPTMAEIKKGKRDGTVYREVRPLRSDVSQPLRLKTGGGVDVISLKNPYTNGKFREDIAKENISEIFNHISFRKFGNEFRKHIMPSFTQEFNSERLTANYRWSELASYIIGDGSYYVNEEQYENFIKKFNTKYSDNNENDKMENGGMIEIGDKVKATKEYGGKSGTVVDKKGSFVTVEYSNGQSDSYHESDLIKKMEKGANMKNSHMMEDGGVIGQEIVFDDNGEQNTGVIKDIHEITGNYIVLADDGRTVLADKELDVISLGQMRKQPEAKKRFSFFEDGGAMYANGGLIEKEMHNLEFELQSAENTLKWTQQQTGVTNQFYKRKVQSGRMTRQRANELIKQASESWARERENQRQKIKEIKDKIERLILLKQNIETGKYEDGGNIAKENNEMLHSQAKEAKHHIEELHNILTSKTKVEPWVVAKMTRAKTDLSDITHYLEGMPNKMARGGKLTDEQQEKFNKVMGEWKAGKLHSGSANGPIVKSQDQAIAIAYSEAYGMDKMLFGGMVNDLSDDIIDRMEGLVPISTLQEMLDNAKFIIADMYEEGFEKDEIMSFLAYKISQIGNTKSNKNIIYGDKNQLKNLGLEGYFQYDTINGMITSYDIYYVSNGGYTLVQQTSNDPKEYIDNLIKNLKKDSNKSLFDKLKNIDNTKMNNGGGVGSLAPNLLMELWYAVWERKTEKYDEIAKKLDKEGVSFTIQNKVSEDAQNTRSRKAIDTFEVQDRIKKIMGHTKMSNGGAVKGSKPSTGEKFGVVIGSKKHSDEYINNGTEINVRKSYGSRMSEVKLIFDANNNLFEVIDYGSSLDGYPNTSAGSGRKYNSDKKETKKLLSQMYNASFATKLLDEISDKMEKGGGVGSKNTDYIEVTNGDTVLSLEKSNGVWEEVDVLQGVKPVNFGRNTYKGNLQQEALIKALNAEYGGGYEVAYVYMKGGKMKTGGGVDAMSTVNKISRISGLRTVAIAEWGDKNNINLATILRDLKAKKITGMDLMTAIVGKPGNKYSKEFNSKYSKMSTGGNTGGWKHKMKTGGAAGGHKNPTLNDSCTITVEGNIKMQPSDSYKPVYENDVIMLRVYKSSDKDGAYDVQLFSTSEFWHEFDFKERRRRSKMYVDEVKSQISSLLQKDGVKLKSLKMITGKASM